MGSGKYMILLVLSLAVISNCQMFSSAFNGLSDLVYTSSSLIENSDLSSVAPSVSMAYDTYTSSAGVLGYGGPLGPFGPLGLLGPLGDNSWNPSQLISGTSWDSFSQFLTLNGGPLSQDGPLGSSSVMNPSIYYGNQEPGASYFASSDFAKQLRGIGVFSSLGPIGALGPLGPLGPLGQIGGHGFSADSNGNFVDSDGSVHRQVSVNYDGTNMRVYNLVETYNSDYAINNPSVLDTSFMVMGNIEDTGASNQKKYKFTSDSNQIINIALVPEKSLDIFSLSLYDGLGKLIGQSTSSDLVQTITVKVMKGARLTAAVSLQSSLQLTDKTFRLIVVGSTPNLNANNVSGGHVKHYYQH